MPWTWILWAVTRSTQLLQFWFYSTSAREIEKNCKHWRNKNMSRRWFFWKMWVSWRRVALRCVAFEKGSSWKTFFIFGWEDFRILMESSFQILLFAAVDVVAVVAVFVAAADVVAIIWVNNEIGDGLMWLKWFLCSFQVHLFIMQPLTCNIKLENFHGCHYWNLRRLRRADEALHSHSTHLSCRLLGFEPDKT